jgi:uncharacterized protein (TIGR04255 family)
MQHRPAHLPDFANPPLDEVVLGVQFAPVPGFTSVNVREVWDLFKDEFPNVQDHPRLHPIFETFGGTPPQPLGFPSFFMGGGSVGRVWFVSETENHLLQFQPDRFLANWRKSPNDQPYPRYERIAETYEANLKKLTILFSNRFGHDLMINQAEITYINIIHVNSFREAKNYFENWKYAAPELEGLNITTVEVIQDGDEKPFARLIQEIQSAYSLDGKKLFKMSLTFRGKPAGEDGTQAMNFLAQGRGQIVLKFKDMTTIDAHKFWGLQP